jgi:hypothetical protein
MRPDQNIEAIEVLAACAAGGQHLAEGSVHAVPAEIPEHLARTLVSLRRAVVCDPDPDHIPDAGKKVAESASKPRKKREPEAEPNPTPETPPDAE